MLRCSACSSLTHPGCDQEAEAVVRLWQPGRMQPSFSCAHCRMAQLSQIDQPHPKLRVSQMMTNEYMHMQKQMCAYMYILTSEYVSKPNYQQEMHTLQMQLQFSRHHVPHMPDGDTLMPPPVPLGTPQDIAVAMGDAGSHPPSLQHLGNGSLKRPREEPTDHDGAPLGKRAAASEGGDLCAEYGEGGMVTRLPVCCRFCVYACIIVVMTSAKARVHRLIFLISPVRPCNPPPHPQVVCNGKRGIFVVADQRVLCMCNGCRPKYVQGRDMSCTQFEAHAGMAAAKKWKASLKVAPGSVPEASEGGRCGQCVGGMRVDG